MRKVTVVSSAVALAVASGVAAASPALADGSRSGPESGSGVIVASGVTGTRQVVYSVIHMHGVFHGVGRIVEVDSLPTDPDNVNRDDFVFRQGTLSLESTILNSSAVVDPQTCVITVTLSGDSTITSGTGIFAHASGTFDSTVNARGTLPRASDGTCNEDAAPLHEVDTVQASGWMSLGSHLRGATS